MAIEERRHRGWAVARLVLGLALLAWIIARNHPADVARRLAGHPAVLAVFLLQPLVGVAVEATRLVLLLRSQHIALPWWRSVRLVIIAVFFGYFVPGGVGGDVIKVLSLGQEYPDKRVELIAVALVDRIAGLLSLLLVAITAALLAPSFRVAPVALQTVALAAAVLAGAIVLAVLVAWSSSVRSAGWYRALTTGGPVRTFGRRILDGIYAFRDHRGALVLGVAVSMIAHVSLIGAFALGASVLLPGAPASLVAWLSPLAMIANLIPLTPAGLGVGEAAFGAAFRVAGFAGGAQLLLAWRAALLLIAVVGGILYSTAARAARPAEAEAI